MSKISVICASAPKPNPGMLSVDLAFYAFSKRHGFDDDVTYYHLYTEDELHSGKDKAVYDEITRRQKLPFKYECFRDRVDEIAASDVIIFWGDFLHMAHYLNDAGKNLYKTGIAKSHEEGVRIARQHFFLVDAETSTLNKVIMFGSTLLFNRSLDYRNPDYHECITHFLQSVNSVRVRDVYSAFKVSEIRSDYNRSFLGLDCSLLLQDDDMRLLDRSDYSADESFGKDKVGIFFGRSDCDTKVLGKFAGELSKSLSLDAQWLSWRLDKSARRIQRRIKGYFRNFEVPSFPEPPLPGDLYEIMSRYKFIITDTYHVCLNAWRLGVPAVCVGQAVPESEWSVSSGSEFYWRDKRQVFYSMYDATEFYTYTEEIRQRVRRKQRVEKLKSTLKDSLTALQVSERMRAHANSMEQSLISDIDHLLKK